MIGKFEYNAWLTFLAKHPTYFNIFFSCQNIYTEFVLHKFKYATLHKIGNVFGRHTRIHVRQMKRIV